MVMEFVGGGTLGDLLRDPDEALPLDWKRASRIIMGAAAGLGAAHRHGIVHRNATPAHLILTSRSGDDVKICSFGVARMGQELPVAEAKVMGTIGYLSPEQALGKEVDARSDVYTLALTWYQLLTAQRAFHGTTAQVLRSTVSVPIPDPRQINGEIPGPVAELLVRMGDLDRERRPKNGTVVAEALRSLLA